ncbi:MAG: type II toxin-antitoxin system VapC family toxin [Marmoricola sp.]
MILLDSSVVLWSVSDPERIGPQTRAAITRSSPRYVSSVTHVELVITAMTGRLRIPDDLGEVLEAHGLTTLPFTEEHAQAVALFPELAAHDPFDRMLAAQAASEGLELITSNRVLLGLDRPWISDCTT